MHKEVKSGTTPRTPRERRRAGVVSEVFARIDW
jgi:hypothetical protein